ncbi:MAG: hypothetical protein LBJ73_04225 [Rickettsiales bacterium]|jgi:hypothetical protein|nr:hypothetical protein [Rickettsiales bacterium]
MKYQSFEEIVKFMAGLEGVAFMPDTGFTERWLVADVIKELTPTFVVYNDPQTDREFGIRLPMTRKNFARLPHDPQADALLNEIERAHKENDEAARVFMKDLQLAAIVFSKMDAKDIRNDGVALAFRKIKEIPDPQLQICALASFVRNRQIKDPIYETAVTELANNKLAESGDLLLFMGYLVWTKDKNDEDTKAKLSDLFNIVYVKSKEVFKRQSAAKDPNSDTLADARNDVLKAAGFLRESGIVNSQQADVLQNDIDSVLDIQKAIAGESTYIKKSEDNILLENTKLSDENKALKKKGAEETAKANEEIKGLQAQADALNSDKDNLTRNLSDANEQIEKLREELSRAQSDLESANKQLGLANGRISTMQIHAAEVAKAVEQVRAGVGSKGIDNLKKLVKQNSH